ncbi:SDR family oxidoreductase [Amycolatopsis alkalitolerans]|uniref:SDR family oxidoreductase n=1 Tax=Amycolatopsis alkalitolerans TaxID=2547244 RepID=A0A5C4LPE5_9PSEU|nr:SDR family oxidoreductase [Amycolatopsis alkalitolerans]TNC19273.1 SDR family oxidoreductase [Amycolatopsis alkalitolerans]
MSDGPVALITGGSRGIGSATAHQLLSRGHRVAVTGRDRCHLERLAEEVGRPAELLTLPGDAADHEAVGSAVKSTLDAFGRLDAAIANAGFATHDDDVADGDPRGWREMVLTNVLGPALLINAALPALRRTQGRIVLVGSIAGLTHLPGNIYGMTKWAITGLAENTRLRVTGDGIGVTLISPGGVETTFFDPIGGPRRDRPGGYLSPDQVAASIVWAITQPSGVDVNTLTVRPVGSPK